jgi:hypothetical protein
MFDMYTKADVHINSDQSAAIITFGGDSGSYVISIDISDGSTNDQYMVELSSPDTYKQYTSTLLSDTMIVIHATNGASDPMGYTHMVDMSDWSINSYMSASNVPPMVTSMINSGSWIYHQIHNMDDDEMITVRLEYGDTMYAKEYFMMASDVTIAVVDPSDLTLATYTQNIATDDQTATTIVISTSTVSLDIESYEITANVWYNDYKDLIMGETSSDSSFGPVEFTCYEVDSSDITVSMDYAITDSSGADVDDISFTSSSGEIMYDGDDTYKGDIMLTATYTFPYGEFTSEKTFYAYIFYNGMDSEDDDDEYCMNTTSSAACGFYVFLLVMFIILSFLVILMLIYILLKLRKPSGRSTSQRNAKVGKYFHLFYRSYMVYSQ